MPSPGQPPDSRRLVLDVHQFLSELESAVGLATAHSLLLSLAELGAELLLGLLELLELQAHLHGALQAYGFLSAPREERRRCQPAWVWEQPPGAGVARHSTAHLIVDQTRERACPPQPWRPAIASLPRRFMTILTHRRHTRPHPVRGMASGAGTDRVQAIAERYHVES